MATQEKDKAASAEQNAEIKCLAECPKCRDGGVRGLCGFDSGHTSAHRCNRCSHTWS